MITFTKLIVSGFALAENAIVIILLTESLR